MYNNIPFLLISLTRIMLACYLTETMLGKYHE